MLLKSFEKSFSNGNKKSHYYFKYVALLMVFIVIYTISVVLMAFHSFQNLCFSTAQDKEITVIQHADGYLRYTHSNRAAWKMFKKLGELNSLLTPEKTVVTLFSHNIPKSEITIDNFIFPLYQKVNYLGIILDKKPTWKLFLVQVIARCDRGFIFLRMIMRTNCGTDPQTVLIFFKYYMRSILDYRCTLYGSANKYLPKRVNGIQNKA